MEFFAGNVEDLINGVLILIEASRKNTVNITDLIKAIEENNKELFISYEGENKNEIY